MSLHSLLKVHKSERESESPGLFVCLDSEKGQSAVKGFDITGIKIADGVSHGMLLHPEPFSASCSEQVKIVSCLHCSGLSSHQCESA